MNSSDELKFPYASPVAELKEKWRELRKSEKDYWRAQFASARTSKSIRSEMVGRLGVFLYYDVQLTHFRKWVARQDKREAAEKAQFDAERALALNASSPVAGPSSVELRQLYRQCLKDLERSAFRALLGPSHSESLHKYAHKNVEDFYLDVLCLCVFALIEESTPRHGLN